MESIAIRSAGTPDQLRVVELLWRQIEDHSLHPPRAAFESAVAHLLARPDLGRILVAAVDDEIVGVAQISFAFALEHGGRTAWLDELYVEPAQRRKGIGGALLRAACQLAQALGAHAVDLEVESGHEPAFRLYERHGFTKHERQRFFTRLAPPVGTQ